MAEAAQNVSALKNKVVFNVVQIQGKVLRVTRHNGSVYTQVVCPAADLYSKPAIVEVRSKTRWASVDEEITCSATLGGYPGRQYRVTDPDTGEVRAVNPVNLTLDLNEE